MTILCDAKNKSIKEIIKSYRRLEFSKTKMEITSNVQNWGFLLEIDLKNSSIENIDDFFSIKICNGKRLYDCSIEDLINSATYLSHIRFTDDLDLSIENSDFVIKLTASSLGESSKFDMETEKMINEFTSDKTERNILRDIAKGHIQTQIADNYNVSQTAVSRLKKSYVEFLSGKLYEKMKNLNVSEKLKESLPRYDLMVSENEK